MVRQSPTQSATKFKVGTRRKGNDGNMWKVVETRTGVQRWQKISSSRKSSKKKSSSRRKSSKRKSSSRRKSDKIHKIRLRVCSKAPKTGIRRLTCLPPDYRSQDFINGPRIWPDGSKLPGFKKLGIKESFGLAIIPHNVYKKYL